MSSRSRSPAKRSSDRENMSSSASPKRPKVASMSQPQQLSKRKVLEGIPNPSSRSASQGAKPRRTTGVVNNENANVTKNNEVATLLRNVMKSTRKTQAEPNLDQHIQDNVAEETSGIIKSVKLYNFMCHESFNLEFHPNLNFITGENGSGKSAVLSGILVGLGAKALTTARTKSIKSLVMTGKEFAKIEMELYNRGLIDSDKYSEVFTIERMIDSRGPTTYRIRSHGKWRALKKSELDYILMALGIQLDNPVAILNQETARSFLRSKDPKDKYKLFYEGTLLKSCDDLLKDSKANIEAARENFNKSLEVIKAQNTNVERLQKLMRKIAEVDDMKRNVRKLEAEGAWSKVLVSEKTIDDFKKKIEAKDQKTRKLEEGKEKLLQERQALVDEASPNSKQKEEIRNELRLKQAEFDNTRREWQVLQKALGEQKMKLRMGKVQEESLQKKVRVMSNNVEKLKKDSQDAADERKREVSEKKEELEAEKERMTAEMNTLKADGEQFRNGANSCRAEMVRLEEEMRGLSNQMSRLNSQLRDIQQNRVNKYAAFGPQMESLIAKIRTNQNKFHKQPRGPLGACFSVKNPKWIKIIEHVLGAGLHNFVVDNSKDSVTLNTLIAQVYGRNGGRDSMGGGGAFRRPNVFLMEFGSEAYDISKGRATMRNHPTILDMIKVENDDYVVSNALCDMAKAERILLFDNKIDAIEILKDQSQQGFPRTCVGGFSSDFYKITPDPYFRVDALRTDRQQFGLLKLDTQNKAKSLTDEIAALEEQCAQLRPLIDDKRKEESQLRGEFEKRDNKLRSLLKKCHQLSAEIQSLVAKTASRTPDINNYIEELNDMQTELTTTVEANRSAQEFMEENKDKLEELAARKSEFESEVQVVQERISQLEGSKDLLKGRIQKADAALQKFMSLIRQATADKEVIEKDIVEAEQELQERITTAEVHGERVETNRSPSETKSELASVQAKIAEAEKHLGDKRKIALELKETKKKHEAFQADFRVWYNLYKALFATITCQDKQFHKSVDTITTSLQTFFKGLIGCRGYKGTLTIDNTRKELFYFVCPDAESNTRIAKVMDTNDTKAIKNFLSEYGLGLSGGECSFSTICFIVSMWQAMQCPFFMLDEFDVFMDAFNRKASQNALIAHAKRHPGRQFFLLSPLELSEVPEKEAAKICRLSPPKRDDADRSQNNGRTSDGADASPLEPDAGPSKRLRRK